MLPLQLSPLLSKRLKFRDSAHKPPGPINKFIFPLPTFLKSYLKPTQYLSCSSFLRNNPSWVKKIWIFFLNTFFSSWKCCFVRLNGNNQISKQLFVIAVNKFLAMCTINWIWKCRLWTILQIWKPFKLKLYMVYSDLGMSISNSTDYFLYYCYVLK